MEAFSNFYNNDRTCKECRKTAVKANRVANAEHYKEYERQRFKNNPARREANKAYAKTKAGKKAGKKSRDKWLRKNIVKRSASILLGNYVRDGKVIKPDCCENCKAKHDRLHGHHDDYSKPLDVRWLCPLCHTQWHRDNGSGING